MISYKVRPGQYIGVVAEEMANLARNAEGVFFYFNDVGLYAAPTGGWKWIETEYHAAIARMKELREKGMRGYPGMKSFPPPDEGIEVFIQVVTDALGMPMTRIQDHDEMRARNLRKKVCSAPSVGDRMKDTRCRPESVAKCARECQNMATKIMSPAKAFRRGLAVRRIMACKDELAIIFFDRCREIYRGKIE